MADTQQNILINIDLETGEVNSQLDQIDSKIKNLGDGAKIETFKSVRNQIREAREEAVRLAIAIEQASENDNIEDLNRQYAEATKKAADLNDAVVKTNKSISNADPGNRLQGLIGITQGAVAAVQGLAGAFTILGVDSETANESIARLQGLIALTGALSSIDDIVDAYKDLRNVVNLAAIAQRANNAVTVAAAAIQAAFTGAVNTTSVAFRALKVAIASTGIGLLVVAIAAAVVAIASWISSSKEAEEQANRQKEAIDRLTQAYEDETREIDAANKKKLLQLRIQGASEARIREEQYAQARVARDRALQAELALEQQAGVTSEQLAAARKARIDAQNQLEIVSLENQLAAAEQNRDELAKIEQQKTDEAKRQGEQRNKDTEENLKELNDLIINLRADEKRRRQSDFENEVDDIKKKYERAIALAKAYGRNSVELEVSLSAELIAARQRRDQEGRRFFLEESLSIVENQAKDIARRVEALSAGGAIVPDEVKQQFSAEIKEVFAAGAKLRLELADQVRKDRIAQAEKILKENKPLLEALKKGIENDFKVATAQIRDEINNSEQSLNKGIELIIERATEIQVENRIKNLENLLEETLKPFRKDIVGESGLQRFFRKTFTTISLVGDDILTAQEKLDLEILNQADKSAAELFDLEENAARRTLGFRKTQAEVRRNIEFNNAKLEYNNAKIRGENLLDAQIKFAVRQIEINKQYKDEITKLDEDFETDSRNRFDRATQKRIDNEQARIDLQNKARRRAERGLFSIEPEEDSFTRNFLEGTRSRQAFDKALNATQEYYTALADQENARYAKELSDAKFQGAELEKIELQHKQNLKVINSDFANDIDAINRAQLQSKLELYEAAGNAINNLGTLFEQGTVESKIAGLASIAIDTAAGFTRGLAIAQESSKATGPAAAYAFPIFYAQQAAAVLAAANRARQIINQVKGGSSGSGSSNVVAPSVSPINASLFNLPPQAQDVRVVNQASQVVRAYITNDDLRSAQEKQAFLNKLSSF